MNFDSQIVIGMLISYFFGAIPFGLLIGKIFYNKDIRKHGSKNPGATNVWRVLGAKPGATTLFLDTLKGFAPVLTVRQLYPTDEAFAIVCGLGCIAGHNWSLFLRGKGGKGVATSAGVFLALLPAQMGLALLGFGILFGMTRYVSVGSMGAASILFATCFFFETSPVLKTVVGVCALIIVIKHIPNIKRLIKGKENRASWGK